MHKYVRGINTPLLHGMNQNSIPLLPGIQGNPNQMGNYHQMSLMNRNLNFTMIPPGMQNQPINGPQNQNPNSINLLNFNLLNPNLAQGLSKGNFPPNNQRQWLN